MQKRSDAKGKIEPIVIIKERKKKERNERERKKKNGRMWEK